MIGGALLGAAFGMLSGVALGFAIIVMSRDGIWPEIWAWMCIVGVVVGAIIGALIGGLS